MTLLLLYAARFFVFLSLFSPLIVHGDFYFPYIVPKTIFFQITAVLALFFYVLLAIADKKYLPKWDILTKAVLAFFGIYALAGILGANPERSFFGTYERMLGVVNLAHFVALFFVVKAVFVSMKDWLWLFRVFLFASVLVGLYGLGQWLGLGFLYHAGAGRIDATIGNSAFVAGYFIFAVFFAVFALIKDSNLGFKYFYVFSLVLSIWAVYASATRGGILGLAAAAIVLMAAYFFRPVRSEKEKKFVFRKEFLLAGAAAALLVFGLAFFTGGKSVFLSPVDRMLSISLTDTTTNTRVLAAKSSWEGFLERPIVGWGPQNYNLVFDKYYNPKIYPMENWFDHAHSIIFDTLVATGAVGFIVYLLFLCIIVFISYRFVKAGANNYWLGVSAIALLAAYFTQNVFVFDSLVTYLPFFLFVAFVGVFFSPAVGGVENMKSVKRPVINGQLPIPAVLILSAIFVFVGYWLSVKPALGAYYAVRALMVSPDQTGAIIGYFKKSFDYGTPSKDAEIAGRVVDIATQLFNNNKVDQQKKKDMLDFASQEAMRVVEENPLDFRNHLYLASFLHQSSSLLGGNSDALLKEADKVLADAEKLAPQKQLLYLEWGRVKSKLGDHNGAVEKFKKAVELNSNVEDSRWRLASAYVRAGETENGEEEAKEARRIISEKTPDIKINTRAELDFGQALREKGFEDKAFVVFNNIFENREYVSDEYTLITLAEAFARKGDKEKAVLMAQRVAEVNPSLKEESERFIKAVESK